MKRGLKAELIAFTPSEYHNVLFEANFRLQFTDPSWSATESLAPGFVVNPAHCTLLDRVELELRQFISKRLHDIEGSRWVRQRVPESMYIRWKERRDFDKNNPHDRAIYPDIYYADFGDLQDIMCRKDNWRDTFEIVFRNADDLRASFRRLIPIRNSLKHGRGLSRSDALPIASLRVNADSHGDRQIKYPLEYLARWPDLQVGIARTARRPRPTLGA